MIHPSSLAQQFIQAARVVLSSFLFLFPLFFLPFTLDPLEINKQSLLLICIFVSFVLLTGALLIKKETRVHLGLVQLFPIGISVVFGISACFSFAPYVSWVGTSGAEYTSVLTWVGLSLLFLLCTLFQTELRMREAPWILLLAGASLAGLLGTLSVFGISLVPFFPSLAVSSFNTIGTVNALAVFLMVMSLFACARLATNSLFIKKQSVQWWVIGMIVLLFLETLTLLLAIDYSLLWVLLLFGCAVLFIFAIFRPKSFPSTKALFVPVIFATTALVFWLILPTPFKTQIPLEVSPSFRSSVTISNSALHASHPLIGSGPGTYAMDYAKYHPLVTNETDFWNTRFDRASSFVLTLAPTVGYLGTGLYVSFLLFLLWGTGTFLMKQSHEKEWNEVFHVFLPWLVIAVSSFVVPFNSVLVTTFIVLSAFLASLLMRKEQHLTFSKNKAVALLSAICFVSFAFILFIGIFLTTGRYTAEIAYARAIRADRSHVETQKIVTQLDRAATLNQWNDDYVRNLSAALLLRVQDELKTVSPSVPLSQTAKKYLQALVAASVNASARATELSPYAAANWMTRGEVYRSLTGLVDKASSFSVDAYKHAIDLEPLNPSYWTELGKTYLAIADVTQPLVNSKDASSAAKAKQDWQSALDEAEKSFTKATSLKSNYAPAHFQLALVYERKGKLDLAIQKLESVQNYNDTDVGVGFELGMLYVKRGAEGDLDRAKRVYEHVITLAPSYSDAHWFLASVYEKQGDRARAIQEVESVLKLNPSNQIVKTRLEKLKRVSP